MGVGIFGGILLLAVLTFAVVTFSFGLVAYQLKDGPTLATPAGISSPFLAVSASGSPIAVAKDVLLLTTSTIEAELPQTQRAIFTVKPWDKLLTIHSRLDRIGDQRILKITSESVDVPYKEANQSFVFSGTVRLNLQDVGLTAADAPYLLVAPYTTATFSYTADDDGTLGRRGMARINWPSKRIEFFPIWHDRNNALWSLTGFDTPNGSSDGKKLTIRTSIITWTVSHVQS